MSSIATKTQPYIASKAGKCRKITNVPNLLIALAANQVIESEPTSTKPKQLFSEDLY